MTKQIWLLSDPHLLAESLHDDGPAFENMQDTTNGKRLTGQEDDLRSFVELVCEKKPAVLIVTGDLTFNGEFESLRRFAKICAPLKTAGIKLLVVPGNHDIDDSWACRFEGTKRYSAEQISPTAWQTVFADTYLNSLSRDPSSLAYSHKLGSYRLLLLDSCIYHPLPTAAAPVMAGNIAPGQAAWIRKQLAEAEQAGESVLAFLHHNLLVHNKVVYHDLVVDNYKAINAILKKGPVRTIFSGHTHAQNIVWSSAYPEVSTSAFCMTDQGYGIVDLDEHQLVYQRHRFSDEKTRRANFELLKNGIYRTMVAGKVADEYKDQALRFLDQVHWQYFIGQPTTLVKKDIMRYLVKNKVVSGVYLNSMLEPKKPVDHWHVQVKW